jgi:hypothetical protein
MDSQALEGNAVSSNRREAFNRGHAVKISTIARYVRYAVVLKWLARSPRRKASDREISIGQTGGNHGGQGLASPCVVSRWSRTAMSVQRANRRMKPGGPLE